MSATAFDTLKLARRLEATGMPPQQAAGVAEVLAEAMVPDPATRGDLARLETVLRTEIDRMREEFYKLRSEFEKLRGETPAAIATAKVEILRWIVPLILAQLGLTVGVLLRTG